MIKQENMYAATFFTCWFYPVIECKIEVKNMIYRPYVHKDWSVKVEGFMQINIFMPTLEEEGVYCFANVGRLVYRSVCRPNGFRR